MIELKNCPICEGNSWNDLNGMRDDNYWEAIDYHYEPTNFKTCKGCGFLTYDYVTNEELGRRYEMIRPSINANNIITGNRKLQYHRQFLSNELEERDIKKVLDYGCSIGMFLKDMRDNALCEVKGIEINASSQAVAKGFYGLDIEPEITDEFKEANKGTWDMISMYHVLEHLQYPKQELDTFHSLLRDDGYLYIAVPEYLDTLEEASGSICRDFENLYHLNHINCFTKTSLTNLLKVSGFKIVKESDSMYGYTVLAQKTAVSKDIVKQSYKDVEATLKAQKKAIEFFTKNEFKKATVTYPNYPDAWIHQSLKMENFSVFKNNLKVLEDGLEATNNHLNIQRQLGMLYYTWDQSKKNNIFYSDHVRKAEKILTYVFNTKQGADDLAQILGMIEYKYKKDPVKAQEWFDRAIDINPTRFLECTNYILAAYSGH